MNDEQETAQLRHEIAALRQRVAELETYMEVAGQAAAALRQSEERFTKIFRASPVAVVISTASEGRYVEVNQRFTDLTGYQRTEVIGHTSAELGIWAAQADRLQVGQVLEQQAFVRDQELTFRTRTGRVLTALASFEIIELDGVMCVLTMCQDITERQRAAVELERLYHEAQEAVRGRDDFLLAAAHELRTPVTSLRGYTQLLQRTLERDLNFEPARTRKALTVIDDQADKLTRLVNRLLDLSHIQAGQLVLSYQETDLVRLVEQVVAAMQSLTTQHTMMLHTPATVVASVDALRFEQVLTNLLNNAIQYSPAGSEIQIELAPPTSNMVELRVTNQGRGISPEQQQHIFDRFYRGQPQKDGSGMGLGLYIAHQIVTLHGGQLVAEAPPEGGTRLVVALPLAHDGAKH